MYPYTNQHIHFVGIGGIGMSGLALILKRQGYTVSGCDLDNSQQSIAALKTLGCCIAQGNNQPLCHDSTIDIVVYSSAVPLHSPELVAARARGIPTIARARILAALMSRKFSIAVAGAHGKTTTTSMLGHILMATQHDPTLIIGGHVAALSSNARLGNGDLLVAEADESDKSFLQLMPEWAVVTNIDYEHLDVYASLDEVKDAFRLFLHQLPFYGKAFLCLDDPHIQSLLPLHDISISTYGIDSDTQLRARDVVLGATYTTCTVWRSGEKRPLGGLYLSVPGKHNLLNALASMSVCLALNIPFASIAHALAQFAGVDRRFTYRGMFQGAELFDDYGHHPAEIEQVLTIARQRAKGRLIVAFQPHRYSRTKGLWDDFISVFSRHHIDKLIITDIYAASEAPIPNISGSTLAEALQEHMPERDVCYVPAQTEWNQVCAYLTKHAKPDDLVLLLGAGKLYKAAEYLTQVKSWAPAPLRQDNPVLESLS